MSSIRKGVTNFFKSVISPTTGKLSSTPMGTGGTKPSSTVRPNTSPLPSNMPTGLNRPSANGLARRNPLQTLGKLAQLSSRITGNASGHSQPLFASGRRPANTVVDSHSGTQGAATSLSTMAQLAGKMGLQEEWLGRMNTLSGTEGRQPGESTDAAPSRPSFASAGRSPDTVKMPLQSGTRPTPTSLSDMAATAGKMGLKEELLGRMNTLSGTGGRQPSDSTDAAPSRPSFASAGRSPDTVKMPLQSGTRPTPTSLSDMAESADKMGLGNEFRQRMNKFE